MASFSTTVVSILCPSLTLTSCSTRHNKLNFDGKQAENSRSTNFLSTLFSGRRLNLFMSFFFSHLVRVSFLITHLCIASLLCLLLLLMFNNVDVKSNHQTHLINKQKEFFRSFSTSC